MTGVEVCIVVFVLLAIAMGCRAWWRSGSVWSLCFVAAIASAVLAMAQQSVGGLLVFAVLAVAYFRVALLGLRVRLATSGRGA